MAERITRVRVKNFLSLRDVEVELEKLSVLVGPNASGKSNFVKALRLISEHARGTTTVLSEFREFRDMAHGFDPTARIEIGVEALVNDRSVEYRLLLDSLRYVEEVLLDGEKILHHPGDSRAYALMGKSYLVARFERGAYFGRDYYETALSALPSEAPAELFRLANILKRVSAHSLAPERIRLRASVTAPPELGYYGDNLARFLLHLYLEDRGAFQLVENALRSLVPEVREVIPHIEDAYVEVWLRAEGLREPLKPPNISDGTLRMLAMAALLYSGKSLVILEEPENYVHPHLLEALVDMARRSPSQVILVTHSPHLLDHVEPEEVYVVEKPGRETVVKKLSNSREMKAVKKFLQEGGTLGEAWYSGAMGGVP